MISPLAVLLVLTQGGSPGMAQTPILEDTVRVVHQSWLGNPRLRESSALAASRRESGLLWTLNDSGNPPELFATDSSGRDRGVFRVQGAENRDWEAMALARCGERDCLYVAEVGDNGSRHRSVRLYRVPEPVRPSAPGGTTEFNGVIEFTYEDGPRNAEAILVTGDQDVYLISKERSGGGRVYFIDRRAWGTRGRPVTAKFVHDLPLPDGLGYQITDASLGLNGIDVAIRTYRYIFFFRLENGVLIPDPERPRCDAGGLDAQGEGITWLKDGRLATTSERVMGLGGTISIVECR